MAFAASVPTSTDVFRLDGAGGSSMSMLVIVALVHSQEHPQRMSEQSNPRKSGSKGHKSCGITPENELL